MHFTSFALVKRETVSGLLAGYFQIPDGESGDIDKIVSAAETYPERNFCRQTEPLITLFHVFPDTQRFHTAQEIYVQLH